MRVSNCVSQVRVRHQPFFLGSSASTAGLLELRELGIVSGVALLVIVGSWVVNSLILWSMLKRAMPAGVDSGGSLGRAVEKIRVYIYGARSGLRPFNEE
jgi:hypothetical protein